MDSKEYLKQVVNALVQGDEAAAKEAHHQYVEQKSKDLLKEGQMTSLESARNHLKKLKADIKDCDPKDKEKLKKLKDDLAYAEELFDHSSDAGDFD